jgi:hypothetical protein
VARELLGVEMAGTENRCKKVRTLIRVTAVHGDHFDVVLPAWNSHTTVAIYFRDIPAYALQVISVGHRMHAKVNIGAENKSDITFSDWEIE